ncbi:acetyl-CoA C-acyltransferase [Bacillus thuringiensis]|uniref:acetyl-CoA C-acyltransferase n=1 Tax=Bacillus thuringiensis TaxID=1428 RepID=UPI000A3B4D51|nr:acetyl-CoA C-acyltransferase [Bacillus thuringiensis]MCU4722838.1 acetyl-CoA C-acyltransferase [Bacillus cereus]MBG9751848.1 acetyl-CoA acetyltransferase [Bacillus thuringiensis]MBG9780733.1 acetyl-CoA acetyltransferase [Bacillus thuringiensis]MBG9928141.1 acetyl-CoA acetyltransferase [Bacillus thuringiensis]MDC7733402.1 acetyl-CoA C-acyltransferase [Bacillus thuringiensis]
MNRAVIVEAKRTPIGKKNGMLKEYEVQQLTTPLLTFLSKGIEREIDDVILGNVVGPGGNVARLSALEVGLGYHIPGVTIDRQCGSGLEAIRTACHLIQGGVGKCYIAGGVESTSTSPFQKRARFSPETIGDPDMGVAAEYVAERYNITREMQDEYACLSYKRTLQALEKGYIHDEIFSFNGLLDESIKPEMNYERIIKRTKPAFLQNGTVTAGNSCGVNDGACAVLVMEEGQARKLGYKPVLRFVRSAVVGVDPKLPGTGPIFAVNKLLNEMNVKVEDIDYFEINEAFASKVVACAKELQIPYEKVNVNGGAIALGHPYGASGAMLVTRLFYQAQRESMKYGIATLGIGGGIGIALLFEKVED